MKYVRIKPVREDILLLRLEFKVVNIAKSLEKINIYM